MKLEDLPRIIGEDGRDHDASYTELFAFVPDWPEMVVLDYAYNSNSTCPLYLTRKEGQIYAHDPEHYSRHGLPATAVETIICSEVGVFDFANDLTDFHVQEIFPQVWMETLL